MIYRLYLQLRGYIYVCFSGKDVRRCINLCVRQNLSMWEIHAVSDYEICFYMYADDLFQCKNILKKTHTKAKVLHRYGIPFFTLRYRKRCFFPAALCLVCILLVYYSGFVWKIEIIGNQNLSEDTLIEYLKTNDAGFGARKDSVDCPAIELALRKDFAEVIWASVYIKGTKLVVELQENLNQPAAADNSATDGNICYDLVAAKDATVSSIITRSGTAYVLAGQEVKEGDILVSATQEILDDSGEIGQYYYKSADADIYGIVFYTYEDTIPSVWEEEHETGEKSIQYMVQWNDWMFETPVFFSEKQTSHVFESYYQFHLADNFYLPVFIGKKTYRKYETVEKTYDKESAKELANYHLTHFLSDLEENGVQILSKNVRMSKRNQTYVISGEVKACERITRQVLTTPKEIQQEGTTTDEHE